MQRIKRSLPKLRIRTILLVVNAIVILVPLSGIYFFKLYENELVRQTESELIAQGAFISAMFRDAIPKEAKKEFGYDLIDPPPPLDENYKPVPPELDMSQKHVRPRRPDAMQTGLAPDVRAQKIAQHLWPVLQEARLTTLAAYSLMDANGTVLTGPEAGQSLAHLPEVQLAMQGQYNASLRRRWSDSPYAALSSLSRNTVFRAFAAYPIVEDNHIYGIVLLSRSPRNVLKALYEEREDVLEAAAMVAVAVLLISLLSSRAIGRPLRALLAQVRQVEQGGKGEAIAQPVTHEFAELSAQISEMATKLHERSDYIRTFALHVSHEFKTPLTSIQGALELLRNEEMSTEQREKFLANTQADTERLKHMVARMLELARADALQARPEQCDLGTLLETLAQRYDALGLRLHWQRESVKIPLPADIAETVLVNLFENSLQHGATEVSVMLDGQNKDFILTVADNGQGISATNAGQLFTPFFTTRREKGGTGLGLTIIAALLKAYDAEITLKEGLPHAVFSIRFMQTP